MMTLIAIGAAVATVLLRRLIKSLGEEEPREDNVVALAKYRRAPRPPH
jgi:hypothetical protein